MLFRSSAHVAIARNVTLTVAKAFQDTSVDAGTGSHTFTITVHNSGPSDAASSHITDTVDTRLHVTNVSESGAGQVCAASSGQSSSEERRVGNECDDKTTTEP